MGIIYPTNHKKLLAVFAVVEAAVGEGSQGYIHMCILIDVD